MVPGGGQNDTWHNLSCRGRYAGEIRIELTYYDTRPRELNADEQHQPAQTNGSGEDTKASLSGPRQPRPVKRRPLPADPTGPARPSLPVHTPPTHHQQSSNAQTQYYTKSPDDYQFYPSSQEISHSQYQDSSAGEPPLSTQPQEQSRITAAATRPQLSYSSNPAYLGNSSEGPHSSYEDSGQSAYGSATYIENTTSQVQEPNYGQSSQMSNHTYDAYVASSHGAAPSGPFPQHSPTTSHSGVSPKIMQSQTPPSARATSQYPRSSLSHSISADTEPEYSPIGQNPMENWPTPRNNDSHNEDAPPPPPAHRTSISKPLPQSNEYSEPQSFSQTPAPAVSNRQVHRENLSGSPLSQAQSAQPNLNYDPPIPPSQFHTSTYPPSSLSSQATPYQVRHHRSLSPVRDQNQAVPPSLVPGYEPSTAMNDSNGDLHEERMVSRRDHAGQQPPLYHQNSAPQPQSRTQPFPPRGVEIVQERPHRNSAPVIKPNPLSPVSRTPVRKSVSPQPDSAPAERRRSEQPFSPDSFNAFNPNVESASNSSPTGARYNTPEQAREAAIQHDRDLKRGDGPIIGSDGRIIDPSDHLPTDTWAPEPEQKVPRKGPEVMLRFRHSPQGAQPMPQGGGRRPPNEPRTMSSPLNSHSADNSPAAMNRARLQKKSRMGMPQPNSSPVVPTLDTTSPSPQYPTHRSPASNHALRERENGAYPNGSPTYANNRYHEGSIPPPVPGKIPIRSGQEDWASNSLSEEMSRIDIGIGGGRRTRVQRYGF